MGTQEGQPKQASEEPSEELQEEQPGTAAAHTGYTHNPNKHLALKFTLT